MIWRLAGVVVAIVAAASLRWSSVLSLGTRTSREHSAQLRLSLSARPERVERCRELSDEELARLPAHMRLRTQCEGYSARYRLAITVDGHQLAADTLRGGGLRHDRPLHVFQEHDVAPGRQRVTVETLLPLGGISADAAAGEAASHHGVRPIYEFVPSPESIVEEVVPTSFKVKLFKCFLDSAVSEQIARMVAMKSATENAGDLIRRLSMQYNRARQSRITSELMDVIGGVEALS